MHAKVFSIQIFQYLRQIPPRVCTLLLFILIVLFTFILILYIAKSLITNFLVTPVKITINYSAYRLYKLVKSFFWQLYIYTSIIHIVITMKHLNIHVVVAAVILVCSSTVLSLPDGAPAQACGDFMPQHSSYKAQVPPSNYKIVLHNFKRQKNNGSATLVYSPGKTYKSKN